VFSGDGCNNPGNNSGHRQLFLDCGAFPPLSLDFAVFLGKNKAAEKRRSPIKAQSTRCRPRKRFSLIIS
jgi:hypothetical protein